MSRLLGVASIFLVCLVTFNLWLVSKEDISLVTLDPLLSLSQILSLLSIVLMSISLVLTTRFRFLESLFGGLDKVYQIHRFLGSVAFVFIVNHPLLLAAKVASTPSVSLTYLIPGTSLAYNLGIAALYFSIFAFIFLFFIRLPYHLWKWTHRILGAGFLLSAVHIFIIESDISRSLMLRSWIFSLITFGLASIIYTVFLYRRIGPKYKYTVDKIQRNLDVINIWLKPVSKKLIFNPGQFVFIKFNNGDIGSELHPFSLSSASFEENIRLSVKILGDYTLKLPALKSGDGAEVFGPYGSSLGKAYISGKDDQIWIAGGIGVTPFLSMLRNEYQARSGKNITLFYSYKNHEEGIFTQEIMYLVEKLGNVKFIDWCSREKGRLDANKMAVEVAGLVNTQISICGPNAMMEQLKKQFTGMGVPGNKITYEKFQMV